ncbi:hypothetical protein ONZ45_g14905 [Pleurotus djamor]|nr:hypothetical protein ONZ45_g14905 [Pleurotus djamor]
MRGQKKAPSSESFQHRYQRFKEYKPVDKAELVDDEGDLVFVRANDDVFIVPPSDHMEDKQTEAGTLSGNSYWKARVLEVRMLPSSKEFSLLVSWYYSAKDINLAGILLPPDQHDLLSSLGSNELLYSNHLDIVGADCVQDHVEVISFPDDDPISKVTIDTCDYFYRFELEFNSRGVAKCKNFASRVPLCPCGRMYDPERDIQRACPACRRWFHVGADLAKPQTHDIASKTDEEILLYAPLVRGQGHITTGFEDWQFVGSGWRFMQFNSWRDPTDPRKTVLPENWRTIIGEDFIASMRKASQFTYVCPNCKHPRV